MADMGGLLAEGSAGADCRRRPTAAGGFLTNKPGYQPLEFSLLFQDSMMHKKPTSYCTASRMAYVARWLAVSAMALGLAACDKMKEPTAGEKLDAAIDKTQRAAENAKDDAQKAMATAQRKMEEGAARTEAAAHNAAQAARDAGNAARESLEKSR